jgi:speckle-type POZ protein
MGVGKHVSSSKFGPGGHEWCVRFYPDESTEDCAGNVSVYLCYLGQAKEVRAKFTLTLLEKQGKVQVTDKGVQNYYFSRAHRDWGFPKFVEKSRLLESSTSLLDDYLTIRCVLTVIKPPRTELRKDLVVVPPVELPGHLAGALRDGIGADVTFRVGGRAFHAHRMILAARSPVFKAMLFGPMMEKDTRSIEVDDVEPDIFEMLLHFIYTASLPPCDGEDHSSAAMQHLLVAADRYGMNRLKLICEEKLCKSIDVETVTTTYVLANLHQCERLKHACLEFISSPEVTDAVVESDGFKHLIASWPLLEKRRRNKVAQK